MTYPSIQAITDLLIPENSVVTRERAYNNALSTFTPLALATIEEEFSTLLARKWGGDESLEDCLADEDWLEECASALVCCAVIIIRETY